jgi:DNA-binding NarL/FixJ family response regulator
MVVKALTLRVVVADDSDPVRERIVSLLSELRVRVAGEAADVQGAIDCVCRLRPHLVLLDLCMPGGSGLDVLAAIQAARIPALVVVLTNDSEPECEARARRAGAIAFFNKSRDFLKAVDFVREFSERSFQPSPGSRVSRGAKLQPN